MLKRLNEEQAAHFKREGFLSPVPVFSEDEIRIFRHRIEAFERTHPDAVAWAFDIKCNLLLDWVYNLSVDPRLLDVVDDLIGPDIFLTNSIFRIKEPHSQTHYLWHQDAARIEVEPRFVIIYVALGPVTSENGCLRVIPRSQHRIEPFHLVSYSHRQVARVSKVDEALAVDVALAPGEVGIFDCNLIHGSGPNRSDTRRIGLLNDYSPSASRQKRGQGSGQLIRGVDHHGYIAPEPIPEGALSEANVLARRRILNRYPENVLMGPLEPGTTPSFTDRTSDGLAGDESPGPSH